MRGSGERERIIALSHHVINGELSCESWEFFELVY